MCAERLITSLIGRADNGTIHVCFVPAKFPHNGRFLEAEHLWALLSSLQERSLMGRIRECTVCSRRMYSNAFKITNCSVKTCVGRMRPITEDDRPRYVYHLDGRRKLGEFW